MDVLAIVAEWFAHLDEWAVAFVDTPWVLIVLFTLALVDGFFPAVPSESLVITVAAVVAAGGGQSLLAVVLVAAVGAFVGDQVAFSIGRLIPLERIPFLNRGAAARVVAKVRATVDRRPAPLLVGARFVPGGRVAVNVAAGAVGFPRVTFAKIDVVAVLLWASYGVLLGVAAGAFLKAHPVLAALVGTTLGVLMGFAVDAVMTRLDARRDSDLP